MACPEATLNNYDALLVTFDAEAPIEWARTLSRARVAGKRVFGIDEFLEETQGRIAAPRFELDTINYARRARYRRQKSMIDKLLIAITLPATLLVFGLVSAAIAISMGPPILFKQTRVGQNGAVFVMYKFRTMSIGVAGADVTLLDDVRVTPLGRWLRRHHVDELPQLLNVFIGDMSLVGPRPEQLALTHAYALDTPAFILRQLVRPGITGWAQVCTGYAGDLAETRVKLEFDLYYLKNHSLALDAWILARTLGKVVRGDGAR
jgi:lipopolysaccharide/colanic/teichoic acid biosynthesis glycosyltransferase